MKLEFVITTFLSILAPVALSPRPVPPHVQNIPQEFHRRLQPLNLRHTHDKLALPLHLHYSTFCERRINLSVNARVLAPSFISGLSNVGFGTSVRFESPRIADEICGCRSFM